MATIEDQIISIEEEIRKTPYHKATEHHIGRLRAKLSRLRSQILDSQSKKSGGSGAGYSVKKQGDATMVLVGPPSVGKSTLLNLLTNAQSKVAPYSFTTVSIIPGMMDYDDAKIQILDVPGLIEGAEEGKGRGREVLSVIRAADLLVLMTEPKKLSAIGSIEKSLERNGIRINKLAPLIKIIKKTDGGLSIQSNIKQDLSFDTIKSVARELGVKNAEIIINEKLTLEKLIDAFSKSRVHVPAITVINKVDLLKKQIDKNNVISISAEKNIGIDKLKEEIWKKLNLVRVYLVNKNEDPSFDNPIVVPTDITLKKVSEKIGTEFAENKTKARIWGKGAKFAAQEVSLSKKVCEGMQVRFI